MVPQPYRRSAWAQRAVAVRCRTVSDARTDPPQEPRPLSALPSRAARVLAFLAILVGGGAGGLIGYALVDVQCEGSCDVPRALGGGTGAVAAAVGTAVVAVLVLRAMGEWREIQDRQR